MEKIAFIGEFTQNWNEEGIAKSFEKLGIKVIRFQEEGFNTNEALKRIADESPDLVLMAKLKVDDRLFFFKEIKKLKIPTASWTFDLYFGHRREEKIDIDPIFRCDFVFGPDGGNVQRFRDKGINYHLLRQGIYDEYCYKGKYRKEFAGDVTYVGGMQYGHREVMCEYLKKYGLKRYGRLVTTHVRGDDLNDLYASSSIIIGDSLPSPRYWSNRLYETLGRGGFLIFTDIEGLNEEYEPYKHFIPFKFYGFKSLGEKIEYFLKHQDERIKISEAAMDHTKKHHTLLNRCQQFLDIVK